MKIHHVFASARIVLLLLVALSLLNLSISSSSADLFVSAASRNSIIRFDDSGNLLGDFVAPGAGGLTDPQGLAFGPDGHLYVSSHTGVAGTNSVLRFNGFTGAFIDVFAILPDMVWPAEINFRGNLLYVSDFSAGPTGRISRFDLNGNFVDHFATGIIGADGQSWDANGDILVSSFFDSTIKKYDGSTGAFLGNHVASFAGGLNGPLDNLLLPNGELLVSSFNTGSIKRFDANGLYIDDPITGLSGPQGLQLGDDGSIYAGDFVTGMIHRYDANTFAFQGTFASAGNSTTNNFVFHAIPEPTSGMLFVLGLCGLVVRRRRW